MPFGAPLDEMLRKLRPLAPIVVLVTFSAVPVVEVIVFVLPVTFSVPPPVALKPALAAELIAIPPVKVNVVFVLVPVSPTPGPPLVVTPV